MDQREWQRRVEAVRNYVGRAAAGVAIGASIVNFAPIGIARTVGLENARPAGIKIALVAAAVWAVFRLVRIVRK